jgi:hypothetical protein
MSYEQHKQSILRVFDKTKSQTVDTCELIIATHPSSNTKIPVPRFQQSDKWISRNNELCVEYKCFTCATINCVSLNLFLRRVSKGRKGCPACCNVDEEKRENHRLLLIGGHHKEVVEKAWKDMTFNERLVESAKKFAEMDDETKKHYRLKHFNTDEYYRILPRIKAVGNGKIIDVNEWAYIEAYYCGNQSQFTPVLINHSKESLEKPKYITWMCDECQTDFIGRDLETQKNRLRILCNECSLSNRTFKIRHLNLPNGVRIKWQSVPERRFIEWCSENGIYIENGPSLVYEIEGKKHKYLLDFILPELRIAVELKDHHVWHQQQINSGKFSAKNAVANLWATETGYIYNVIFPKQLADFKAELLKKKSLCKI